MASDDLFAPPTPEEHKLAMSQAKSAKPDDFFAPPTPEEHHMAMQGGPSFGQKVLNGIGMAGRAIDSVTGAPTRAAIFAAQRGQSPLNAAISQFGDSESAPTGKMIAQQAGIPDEEFSPEAKNIASMAIHASPVGSVISRVLPDSVKDKLSHLTKADVAGLGVDLAADPTNLIPAGKGIVNGLAKTGEFLGDAVKGSYLGQKASKLGNALGTGASKIGELMTGVPAQDIRTYAAHAPEINQMMKEAGGSIPEAADLVRNKYQSAIKQTKNNADFQISQALENAPTHKTVELSPVMDQLNQVRSRLHPELEQEDISQIDKLADRLNNVADEQGRVSPSDLADITHFLQKKGKPAFPSGDIFQNASDAEQAAKRGSAQARQMRNENIPGISQPYQTLENLRGIEDTLNKNIINPETPEGALIAAGSGTNERNTALLKKLGDITGRDMLSDAQKLAAAKRFTNPSFSPIDATGKSVYRVGAGGALGAGAAHVMGLDPKFGFMAGAALTSPAALKAAIDAGRIPVDVIQKLTGKVKNLSDADYLKAFAALKGPEGSQAVGPYLSQIQRVPAGNDQNGNLESSYLDKFRQNPGLINLLTNEALKQKIKQAISQGSPSDQRSQEVPISVDEARDQFRRNN